MFRKAKLLSLFAKQNGSWPDGTYAAGMHHVTFDTNLQPVGAGLPGLLSSGVYVYRLVAGDDVMNRKMMLIR
jgi:hypothetical protein